MKEIRNLHVKNCERLISPKALRHEIQLSEAVVDSVLGGREAVRKILMKQDKRFLVVVGPCSIHDPIGALEYAERLNQVRKDLEDRLFIMMRVYFEKPRTTIGWKGLINDPHLDGTNDIQEGLKLGRKLLLQITQMGLPAATEFLDPIVPQYTSDLVSWAAIGARTTESQTHRQMASGLSMPVGFKNSTDGSLQVAIDAMGAAMHPHSFIGIDEDGANCIFHTTGNSWGHIILRGGAKRTNYDTESIAESMGRLDSSRLNPVLMVDCSHANSGKEPARQELVWNSILDQRIAGNDGIIGAMVESNLFEGKQFIGDGKNLCYGVSITDPCLSWASTEKLLLSGYEKLAANGTK
ncbi:MAG: 3-deoxy-7-phosphoheptulonate synthase [Verrucomicrobiota bacterium]